MMGPMLRLTAVLLGTAFLLLAGACTENERRGVSPLPQNRPAEWEIRPFGPMMN